MRHLYRSTILLLALLAAACATQPKRDTVKELEERVVLLEHQLRESERRLEAKIQELASERAAAGTTETQAQEPASGDADPDPEPMETFEPETPDQPPAETMPPAPKRTAEEAYQRALTLIRAHRSEEAKTAFEAFLNDHENHELTPNAIYWLGEAEYDLSNYNQAILTFQRVLDRFGDSNKAPDALLKLGKSRERLGQMTQALEAYRQVVERYPESRAAKIAREWL